MFKLKYLLLLFIPLAAFLLMKTTSSTDFDPTADWKDVNVVYGLLNQNEFVHYIKINKAFLGDGNALIYAMEPDSVSYGGNLEVWLEEYKNGYFNGRIIPFDTISVFNREPGVFYSQHQLMYCTDTNIKTPLYQDCEYYLNIRNKKTGKLITAHTGMVEDFYIEKPKSGVTTIGFTGTGPSEVKWTSSKNGRLYQLVIRFFYTEKDINNHKTHHYLDWVFPTYRTVGLEGGEKMSMNYIGESFFKLVGGKLKPKPNVIRYADSVQFIFSVAADEFSTYMDVNKPSNSIVQDKPEFTNISNGIGLFSSRYMKKKRYFLTVYTEDSLVQGRFTKHLGFMKSETRH